MITRREAVRRLGVAGLVGGGFAASLGGAGCSDNSSSNGQDGLGASIGPGGSADPENLGFSGTVLDPPFPKPTTQLDGLDGQPFDFAAETDGKLSLLMFGYTSCPDVCPRHLGILAETLADLTGPASKANVIFVGVDTARDTPTVIRQYLDNFDERFIGLTGTPSTIEKALSELKLPSVTIEKPDATGSYAVGHPSQIFAFGPDNMAHVMYPFGTRQQQWAKDLPRLITEDWAGA